MSKKKPTDDELLSYIMGDLPLDEKEAIENWLQRSDENRSYLKTLLFLKKEIQTSPMILRKRSWSQVLQVTAIRGGALCFAFVAGLLIQSHWQLIAKNTSKIKSQSTLISQPLSIETQPTGKIL